MARKSIPNSVKVEVRKRCGFGCVICGDPEYDYHHIIHHASGGADSAENLVILCPTHHSSYHRGTIPQSVIKNFNASPFALSKTPFKYLHIDLSGYIPITLGNIGFGISNSGKTKRRLDLLKFHDGYSPFSIEADNSQIFLNADLRSQSGETQLIIERNNLSYSNKMHDFYFKSNQIFIKNRNGSLALHAKIENDHIKISEASILHKGTLFVADHKSGNIIFSSDREARFSHLSRLSIISESEDDVVTAIEIPAAKNAYPLEKSITDYLQAYNPDIALRKKLQKIYDANRCLPLRDAFRTF